MITNEPVRPKSPNSVLGVIRAINDQAIWPLATVVASSIATERALPAALVVASALILVRWIAKGRPFVQTPVDWPIVGLVAMAGVSLLITPRIDLTVPQVGRLYLGVAFFYTLVDWAVTITRVRIVFWGLACAGVILCLGAPFVVDWSLTRYKFLFFQQIYDLFVLKVEDTIHPNVMAGYLALLLPCIFALMLFLWSKLGRIQKTLYFLVILPMGITLILTQSRAGILAAVVGIVAVLALRSVRYSLVIFASMCVLIGFLLAMMRDEIIAQRLEVWSRGWYMVQDFAITGIGMGLFPHVAEQFYPLVTQETLPHSHNLFLQIAVDLGIPGFIAWMFVFILLTVSIWKTYLQSIRLYNTTISGFSAGLLGTQFAIVVHGLFDAVTWGMVRPSVIVWGIWGIGLAVTRLGLEN